MHHLYEIVISNSRMWLKVQASCASPEQSAAFFESRFTGTDYIVDDHQPVTPFTLSERSHFIANWESLVDQLPEGWDDDEFHIVDTPYPWCETLSEDCDCHGAKGRLDAACCSDFGLHDEIDKRDSKSQNVRHQHYIKTLEETIVRRDESRKEQRLERKQRSPSQPEAPVEARAAEPLVVADMLAQAIKGVNRLVGQGYYCSIEERHHPYGEQAIRKTEASVAAACVQLSTWGGVDRQKMSSALGAIAAHFLQVHQAEECAQGSLRGHVDIPDIIYKYIPKKLISKGAPANLRATQLLALNDDMECNVVTMKSSQQEDILAFLAEVQSKLEGHLGIAVPWEELLTRSLRYGDLRLSTFIQEYLNPLVGVVSFSTDILVPTMWAHYARNTGIVVGYDTEALNALGFELRPVVYSEIAPTYHPSAGDAIWLPLCQRT